MAVCRRGDEVGVAVVGAGAVEVGPAGDYGTGRRAAARCYVVEVVGVGQFCKRGAREGGEGLFDHHAGVARGAYGADAHVVAAASGKVGEGVAVCSKKQTVGEVGYVNGVPFEHPARNRGVGVPRQGGRGLGEVRYSDILSHGAALAHNGYIVDGEGRFVANVAVVAPHDNHAPYAGRGHVDRLSHGAEGGSQRQGGIVVERDEGRGAGVGAPVLALNCGGGVPRGGAGLEDPAVGHKGNAGVVVLGLAVAFPHVAHIVHSRLGEVDVDVGVGVAFDVGLCAALVGAYLVVVGVGAGAAHPRFVGDIERVLAASGGVGEGVVAYNEVVVGHVLTHLVNHHPV